MAQSEVQWDVVQDESGTLVVFEHPGDTFVGIFEGTRHIVPDNSTDTDDEFDQQLFRSDNGHSAGAELYAINGGYKIRAALTPDLVGRLVKIEYLKDVKVTGQASPMKDYRISVARDR